MIGLGIFGWFAGALQLLIPSYALRLIRRFGTRRVGWFVATAFVSLALLHLTQPFKSGPGSASAATLVLMVGSMLLVVGMGHVESLFSERDKAHSSESSLSRKWESRLRQETAGLAAERDQLIHELNRRDQLEARLEEAEAGYRFLFNENPLPMWIMELRSCRFLAVNNAALRQYGFSANEFLQLTGRELMLPARVMEFLQDASRPCSEPECRGVWRHCKKDGTLIDVEITSLDLMYANSPSRLVLASDVTDRLRRENDTLSEHRLTAIGDIAGGIAHHFNNLLTVLDGHVSVLMEKPVDLESAERLEHIGDAITRASSLTRQLLASAGRHLTQPERVDLNAVIRASSQIFHNLAGDDIKIDLGCSQRMPLVKIDRQWMDHVLINLVMNARESMPNGGTIAITTSQVRITELQARSQAHSRAGDFVCVCVRDTGRGMTQQVQERLFEPFFTTKDTGEGIGLGLASIRGVIRQFDGWIDFTTEPGAGSEFRIHIPVASNPDEPRAGDVAARASGKATIFLLEGEDRSRALARFHLNNNGYRVIEADSAATAEVLWKGQAQAVDVLVVSWALSGNVSALELVDRFRQTKPALKVLYATSPADAESARATSDAASALVVQPLTREGLLQAVDNLLLAAVA